MSANLRATGWWRSFTALLVLALAAALLPLSAASGQSGNGKVSELNLYMLTPRQGAQPGDYLRWNRPTTGRSDIADYTVERQIRTDNRWSSWSHMGTVGTSVDPKIFEITDWQPACTDWNYRVRANYENGTSGAWSKAWNIITARRYPSRPNLDTTHAGTVNVTDTVANTVELTAKWNRAYCQTDYEVWYRTRSKGKTWNINANWSPWQQAGLAGDLEGSTGDFLSLTPTSATLEHDFTHRGVGVEIAVSVKNRVGWSGWSYIRWTWGFRTGCSDCYWIPITKGDLL